MVRTTVTLQIRDTRVAGRRTLRYRVAVDDALVYEGRLSLAESELIRGLGKQYAHAFGRTMGRPHLVLEQQRALGVALFHLWLGRVWPWLRTRLPRHGAWALIIDTDLPEVLALPWGLLRPPGRDFLCKEPAFSMCYQPVAWPAPPVHAAAQAGPLRVLAVVCRPRELVAPWDLRQEQGLLQVASLVGSVARLELATDASSERVARHLHDTQPQVVQVIGVCRLGRRCPCCGSLQPMHVQHCRECHAALASVAPQAYLAGEDARGAPRWLTAAELWREYATAGVRCLWLNDPYSERSMAVPALAELCRAAVPLAPAVVGWSGSLATPGAVALTAQVYRELARGTPLDRALSAAQAWLYRQAGRARPLPWPAPTVYTRSPLEPLIDPQRVPLAPMRQRGAQRAPAVLLRRQVVQDLVPALAAGTLRSVWVTGAPGMGKRTLAGALGQALVERGYRLLSMPTTPLTPLSLARVINHACRALQPAAREIVPRLLERRCAPGERLRLLLDALSRERYVLLLDRFELNFEPGSAQLRDPWVAALCAELSYRRDPGPHALLVGRRAPADLYPPAEGVALLELDPLPEGAWLTALLHDRQVARRYHAGALSRPLLAALYHAVGGSLGLLPQLQAVLRAPATDWQALQAVAAAGDLRALAAHLYHQLAAGLSDEARLALARLTVCETALSGADLACIADLPQAHLRRWLATWSYQGLVLRVGRDAWRMPDGVRDWLCTHAPLSSDELSAAHRRAAEVWQAQALPLRSETLAHLALDALLLARAHWLNAGDLEQARILTARISRVLEHSGLYDDLDVLQQELLSYAAHPLPLLWLARTAMARPAAPLEEDWAPLGDGVEWWWPAGMDPAGANQELTRETLERALRLAQQMHDGVSEALTLAQLGALAARNQRLEQGLRLVTLSALLLRTLNHGAQAQVSAAVQRLARRLRYTQTQFHHMARQVWAAYQRHHGWDLLPALRDDVQTSS
ncbi:CHAT domain-containing protein [Kallotenue papyrolyticum]|uniref:CHAT domain-containing protein n=1 Tax=Kallotenue papyrolyticum TaxID=1325125 RepID=UPI0004786143|nr:CHAT domain-containing protein [Kallotenue papyrolyticum]